MEYLSQYFDITIDYYNPNIDSKEEYEKRVHEQQRLVSEMNEQTGEFNTVSTAPGDRRRALSFDSRTVLGTFFENLRNQYGRPSDLG